MHLRALMGYPIYHLLHTLHVLNPLEKELDDCKFTDIYFGYFQKSKLDINIYLLDVGMKDNTIETNNNPKLISYKDHYSK